MLAAETAGPLWHLTAGLVVAGFGMGLVLSPLAETVLARVHPAHAAAASGALSTALDVGGAIGVAVIGSVYLSRTGAGAGAGRRSGWPSRWRPSVGWSRRRWSSCCRRPRRCRP